MNDRAMIGRGTVTDQNDEREEEERPKTTELYRYDVFA